MPMYYSHFNLDTTTFSSVPILKYVVKTTSFQSVWEDLNNGFRLGKTIGIVSGETGTGKTLLCHCLISNLSTVRLVTIKANPHHTSINVLTEICDQLKVEFPDKCVDEELILKRLRDFFVNSKSKNERIVIIIDEAQYIKEDLFRHLGFLVHSDDPGRAKQHIILAGNPELIDTMQTIGFVSELEKDVIRCELTAMNKKDSIFYIRRRLAIGGTKNRIFTSSAEVAIFQHTQGIPRLINTICDHCLQIAHKRSEPFITSKTVKHAIKKNFPRLLSIKKGSIKQKFSQFKYAPEMVLNGTTNRLEKVWRPLQEKFLTKNGYSQEEKDLAKVLDSKETKTNLKGISRQKLLKTNKSLVISEGSETENLSNQNQPEKNAKVVSISNSNKYIRSQSIPADMVVISGGLLKSAYSESEIAVDSFLMDLMPVTNRQYNDFIKETNYSPPEHWWNKNLVKDLLDHPVVGVSYEDAIQFADWIGKRLPKVKEWEIAARCPDNRRFPWGDNEELSYFNSIQSGLNKTVSVDSYLKGSSVNGCLNLVGNVWEWIDAVSEKSNLEDGYAYVLGGSFRHECVVNDVIARTVLLQRNHYSYVGFRCAKDLK
ncbi:MAG: SUMF1/EgtB/PvdO family nonheme iron enzyme [Methylococcaceae bacterium]